MIAFNSFLHCLLIPQSLGKFLTFTVSNYNNLQQMRKDALAVFSMRQARLTIATCWTEPGPRISTRLRRSFGTYLAYCWSMATN